MRTREPSRTPPPPPRSFVRHDAPWVVGLSRAESLSFVLPFGKLIRNDTFFPDLSDFFGNLNMGDNDAAAKYVILSSLFQFLLEFLGLVFVVDVIGLYYIDAICSSILLVCMISLLVIFIVMIYQLLVRIISYGYLLIYSTSSASTNPSTAPPTHKRQHLRGPSLAWPGRAAPSLALAFQVPRPRWHRRRWHAVVAVFPGSLASRPSLRGQLWKQNSQR